MASYFYFFSGSENGEHSGGEKTCFILWSDTDALAKQNGMERNCSLHGLRRAEGGRAGSMAHSLSCEHDYPKKYSVGAIGETLKEIIMLLTIRYNSSPDRRVDNVKLKISPPL